MVRRADRAGLWRFALPAELGGRDGTNLELAIVREHLNRLGIGLFNDPQSETSMIGNFPTVILLHEFGTPAQKEALLEPALRLEAGLAFGLTEPNHGSDATYLETVAHREGEEWVIDGTKRFNSGMHRASHDLVFARTSGVARRGPRHHGVHRPARGRGSERGLLLVDVQHAHRPRRGQPQGRAGRAGGDPRRARSAGWRWRSASCTRTASARPPRASARPSSASRRPSAGRASGSCGASRCGATRASSSRSRSCGPKLELVRGLVRRTAAELDHHHHMEVTHLVAMANYRANRLACEAADRAMQTCGGIGYTRHMPFEHIYRHHRRYRITEGSEEIQLRKVAQELFRARHERRRPPARGRGHPKRRSVRWIG